MTQIEDYSTTVKILFWLLWLVGGVVALLFMFFILIVGIEAWPVVLWNMAVVLVESFILFKSARHFLRREKAASELMLWMGIAAAGVPMLAFGGCMLVNSTMRIAG